MISNILIVKHNQRGIALIQVLLISAIISILAIHFSFTAREQLATATAFEQRVKTTQMIKTVQSKIIYTLLTQHSIKQPKNVFPSSGSWNFYGKPFILEQTENTKILAAIQDNSGLLSQQYIASPYWTKVLKNMGFTSDIIRRKQGIIKDWQDKDNSSWLLGNTEPSVLENGHKYRNQAIQLPQEIEWFFEQQPQKLNIIKQISTPYAMVGFNPMNAPETLINLFFEPEIATLIIRERENNTLTRKQIIRWLGDDYDNVIISLFHGTQFKITTQVSFADVQLQETLEIQLQPSENEPVLILARY
ncbi:MAG: general secretion pathway protein K [Psychroserpens sp.]|jgi:general secretion pathway protein K